MTSANSTRSKSAVPLTDPATRKRAYRDIDREGARRALEALERGMKKRGYPITKRRRG